MHRFSKEGSTGGKRHCFSCFPGEGIDAKQERDSTQEKTRKMKYFSCFHAQDSTQGKTRKMKRFSCFHAPYLKHDNKDKSQKKRRNIKLFSCLKKVNKNTRKGTTEKMKRFSCFKLRGRRRCKWLRKSQGKRPCVPFKNKKRVSAEIQEDAVVFPKKHRPDIKNHANNNLAAKNFTFKELERATKNFKEECLLGEGGFGRVYKGKIEKTGETVAVKQLNREGKQGNGEFLVEVMMLSHLCHPRLVNLVGYCSEGDQRLLVYEYLSAGSLENHLLDLPPGRKPMDWPTRMKVALHAAIGLEYLHETNTPPVIYRDLKSSNILLDKDFNAKLSDFGLAKLGPVGGKTHVTSRVMGTLGYCAPEYQKTGKLTVKSDIYSYGVVLLELVTGRRAVDLTRDSEELHLVRWVEPRIKDPQKYSELVDPLLEGNYPRTDLGQVLAIAAMCLNTKASIRPSISDVVAALASLQQD